MPIIPRCGQLLPALRLLSEFLGNFPISARLTASSWAQAVLIFWRFKNRTFLPRPLGSQGCVRSAWPMKSAPWFCWEISQTLNDIQWSHGHKKTQRSYLKIQDLDRKVRAVIRYLPRTMLFLWCLLYFYWVSLLRQVSTAPLQHVRRARIGIRLSSSWRRLLAPRDLGWVVDMT